MGSREFTVSARITADTSSAQRNTRALAKAEQELAARLTELRAKFDAGQISGEKFLRGQAAIGRQSERLKRSLSGIAPVATIVTNAIRSMSRSLLGLTAGIASIAAIGRAFRASVNAAKEQELALQRVRTALSELGTEGTATVKALEAQAAAMQATTRFGDDAVLNAQARIAAFTNERVAIELMTKAATNFASAKGVQLSDAAELIAKTFASSTNSLTRYGIQVEGAAGSMERLKSLITALGEAFGGQAKAEGETFTGQMEQLKNAIGDASEELGAFITKNSFVREKLTITQGVVESLGKAFKFLRGANREAADEAERASRAFERQQLEMIENAEALEKVQIETSKLAEETRRLAIEQGKAVAESDRFLDGVKRLGVTLESEVNQEIRDHAELLEQAQSLYRSGEISAGDLAQIQERVAAAIAKANGEIEATAKVTQSAADGYESASSSASRLADTSADLADSTALARTELLRGATQAVTSAAAFDRLAESIGRAAAVQQALAGGATLTQGGTRIRLRGGSRLTRDAGFGGASRNQSRLFPGLSTII